MRVRELRTAAYLSQSELATRANLSIDAIKKLESARSKRPYPRTIRALAEALGVTPDELVIRE